MQSCSIITPIIPRVKAPIKAVSSSTPFICMFSAFYSEALIILTLIYLLIHLCARKYSGAYHASNCFIIVFSELAVDLITQMFLYPNNNFQRIDCYSEAKLYSLFFFKIPFREPYTKSHQNIVYLLVKAEYEIQKIIIWIMKYYQKSLKFIITYHYHVYDTINLILNAAVTLFYSLFHSCALCSST